MDSQQNTILFAAAIIAIAFIVWAQNVIDTPVLLLAAGAAMLLLALTGRVHPGESEDDFKAREEKDEGIPGLHEHPEAHEEEAHGTPAGH